MIRSYPHAEAPWPGAIWIDLWNASDEERAEVERITGLRVPDPSRHQRDRDLQPRVSGGRRHVPVDSLPASGGAHESLTAAGFVLTERLLLTLRFSENPVFDALYASCVKTGPHSACDVFLRLLEALIDRAADTLEHASAELDALSHRAFHAEEGHKRSVKRASEKLRRTLRKLGRMGDSISQIRDTLLGLGRIAAFVSETGNRVLSVDEMPRLKAVRADITSLNDYQAHLLGKVQFLLDATLGFINIEQNDIVKTLTIVSVVGVPPVLVAGIYGMNFKFMPELDWSAGYPLALLLMVVTGLLPLAWFKWRGWM